MLRTGGKDISPEEFPEPELQKKRRPFGEKDTDFRHGQQTSAGKGLSDGERLAGEF